MALKDGWAGKLYRNTATYGSPSLTEVKNVRNLKQPNGWGKDDVTTRADGGVKTEATVLREYSASWGMLADGGTDVVAIKTAFDAGTPVEFFVMDGPVTNTASRGYRVYASIDKMDLDQDNAKKQAFDVEIKPTPRGTGVAAMEPVVGADTWTVA